MEITFKENKPEAKPPTFGDVEENQFFINLDGFLSQKNRAGTYHSIADDCGNPCCVDFSGISEDRPIKRILPKVTKIHF